MDCGFASFKYDPFGRRIYKSSSSGTSIYAYDGDNLIEETNAAGAVVARYSQGLNIDEPLAMLRSSATSFYHADGLGSITSLANAAGALAQTYTFDSFGKQTASTGSLTNPFQYTGRESDSETGLYYYRARYYDPAVGRFVSEDPMNLSAGLNFYLYADNSSPLYNDPFGLWENTKIPADPNNNTIVCDGHGGIRVQLELNLQLLPERMECLGPCITKHEEVHKKQALAYNPKICGGSADGIQVGNSNDIEKEQAEIVAHIVSIQCDKKRLQEEQCDSCRELLNAQIDLDQRKLEQYRTLLKLDLMRADLQRKK
jgi:RHS repeat-associated protein